MNDPLSDALERIAKAPKPKPVSLQLRFPPELHTKIGEMARNSGLSFNAQVVALCQDSPDLPGTKGGTWSEFSLSETCLDEIALRKTCEAYETLIFEGLDDSLFSTRVALLKALLALKNQLQKLDWEPMSVRKNKEEIENSLATLTYRIRKDREALQSQNLSKIARTHRLLEELLKNCFTTMTQVEFAQAMRDGAMPRSA